MSRVRVMAASGMVGYGFTEKAFAAGLARGLDFIACDAGSMDPGPYYLGAGTAFVSRTAAKRDIGLMLEGGISARIPVLVGSAGGGGGTPHLAWLRDIVAEVARERHLHFRMALIHSEQSPDYLQNKLAANKIRPLGPIGELSAEDVAASHRIVAMMGVKPYQQALADGADVIIAGRSSDAALFAAIPLMRGVNPGLAWHLAKIIECGSQVIEPRTGQDCILGTLHDDYFLVEPADPDKRCTRLRVAAHTLYENPDPYRLIEPEGVLDTSAARYEQLDTRTVKVSGSRFEPASVYTVKLEGVREAGYRTIFFAGVRDPTLVRTIDSFVVTCRERVAGEAASLGITPDRYRLGIRVYGRNAVMGSREPLLDSQAHELGLLVDVTADDEDISHAVLAKARYALLHTDVPGRKCIAGNLAIPFSPSDLPIGMTYRFNVWHVMQVDDPLEPFRIEMTDV